MQDFKVAWHGAAETTEAAAGCVQVLSRKKVAESWWEFELGKRGLTMNFARSASC